MAKKQVRRGWSEGTIYQRADGRWCAQISMGVRDGKRIRRSITGRLGDSKQDILDQLQKSLQQQATKTLAEPSKMTTREFLEHWLEFGAGTSVSPSTMASYRRNLETHVFGVIGHIKAQALTPMHVQSVLSRMKVHRRASGVTRHVATDQPAADRSKQYVFSVLRRAFSRGIQWGVLVRNPCDGCERPKSQKHQINPLNLQQSQEFLAAALESPLQALFVVAIQTGARQGELRALRWSDVNLAEKTLSIRRTLTETDEGTVEKTTKTSKGVRQVTLPDLALEVLTELRKESLRRAWSKNGVVFHLGNEKHLTRGQVNREFTRVLKRANLPRIRFHDLRHTHATILLLKGVHAKIVQERLGHSTIGITIDTYSHVLPSMQEEVSQKLNQLFG